MPKITITIEDEKPQTENGSYIRSMSASVSTGDSAWTDHLFFMHCANRATIRLSEKLHLEDMMIDLALDGVTEEQAIEKLRGLGFDIREEV